MSVPAPATSPAPFLFPVPIRAVTCDPANLGTVDCNYICRGDDGCDYAVKDASKHPWTRHAEWFCTHLADHVGLAGPICKIITMRDNSTAFGSRWEGGVLGKSSPAWWDQIRAGSIPLADIAPVLTKIYAFDHFIHNYDRHGTNFLIREQKNGYAILAFDYSKAWICNGFPLPPLPFDADHPHERTVRFQRALTFQIGKYIDPIVARNFVELLKTVPVSVVKKIIESHPDQWLPANIKNDILSWWASQGMKDRLESVAQGIENGTYL